MDSPHTLAHKQQYLLSEIIEGGYDPEKFAEYMQREREDGEDVNNWSFGSLQDAVEKFKTRESNKAEDAVGTDEEKGGNYDQVIDEKKLSGEEDGGEKTRPKLMSYEEHVTSLAAEPTIAHHPTSSKGRRPSLDARINHLLQEAKDQAESLIHFDVLVHTQKSQKTLLTPMENIKITIGNPRTVHKGMFSKKYTVYKVTTSPAGFEVERRFSDFLWLHNTLARDYPGILIPPMALKSGSSNKLDPAFIQSRMETLHEFMNALPENHELKSSPAVLAFLSAKEAEFTKFQKDSEKAASINPNTIISQGGINKKVFYQKNPVKVESLHTLTGHTECKISPALKSFSSSFKVALKEFAPNFAKCKELLDQLSQIQLQAKQTLDKICEHVTCLYSTTRKLGDTLTAEHLPRWDSLEKVFQSLNDVMRRYGRSFEHQSQIVHDTIYRAVKYSKKEIYSLEEMLKLRDDASELFFKSYVELDNKKLKTFKLGDTSKFGIDYEKEKIPKEEVAANKNLAKQLMLKDETSNVKEMQKFFGFLNQQMYLESCTYHSSTSRRYIRALTEFADAQTKISQEAIEHFHVCREHISTPLKATLLKEMKEPELSDLSTR